MMGRSYCIGIMYQILRAQQQIKQWIAENQSVVVERRSMIDNNRRIVIFLVTLALVISYQIYRSQLQPIHLQTHCSYGYLSKTSKELAVVDCIACYNFDPLASENGVVILDHSLPLENIIRTQTILLYQNDCFMYECKMLKPSEDLSFKSSQYLKLLSNLGFKEKIRNQFFYDNGSNVLTVNIRQNSKRAGFMLRTLLKMKDTVDIESIQKPDFAYYHVQNSFAEKVLISALGLVALAEINVIYLAGFLNWHVSFMFSMYVIYSMLQAEYNIWFTRIFTLLWGATLIWPQYLNYSLTFTNAALVVLMFAGKNNKIRPYYLHLNFFIAFTVFCYLSKLEWIIVSIPQLLHFLHSLGPIYSQDNVPINQSRSIQPHLYEEQQDIELKIRKQLQHQ